MNHQELHCSNGKNTNNNLDNSSISSESEEEIKHFKTRSEFLSDSESGRNHRHIHSHHNHSKEMRKDSNKRTTMDDVLKRLNKYNNNNTNTNNNNDHQRSTDSDSNLLNSAFDLAELATSANDRRNIQETEQRLTSMIDQLQHLRQKLVSQQQVSVR